MAVIQTIEDGPRNLIIKVDGTGAESNTLIVNVSTLQIPCTLLSLRSITYNLAVSQNMQVLWDATTPLVAWNMSGDNDCHVDFTDCDGIPNNAGAGRTGNVLINGGAASNNYSLFLRFYKRGTIAIPV